MSIIDTARKALTEIPISDILRERLSLALDYSVDLERKVHVLDAENGKLQAKLEAVEEKAKNQALDIERLNKLLEEEIFISHGVEFRKGKRTRNKWLPFCPKCHLPAEGTSSIGDSPMASCTAQCGWSSFIPMLLDQLVNQTNTQPA